MADLQNIDYVIISKYLHRYIKKPTNKQKLQGKTMVIVLG